MVKQFNNTAILTSKNPEAFLNFAYGSGPNYYIIPSCVGLPDKTLYINGLDINSYEVSIGFALKLDANDNIASFLAYTNSNDNFDIDVVFNVYTNPGFAFDHSETVTIKNRPYIISSGVVNSYTNDDLLVEDQASYMLIRTNPKFTGNIKLTIDSSNVMYLDTFKVSDILSNKKYRHQVVSGNSVLASDIRNVFSSLPFGELYRVDVDNTLSIGIPKTDLREQYNVTYNYGTRLIKDELYPEDNGILAPLWINSKLPDYFAVFRLEGVYNPETYTDEPELADLAFKYLKESDLIRSWSLKEKSPLGKYLATHMADVTKIQAPVFLSLTDPDIVKADSDPNTWYGIAVDKGVVTGRSETPYFFNQKAQNFTDLNAFISQGFERNTLLCPNIVNMEFLFSDEDVSLYSMNRYFGFYLTENILYNLAYYSDSSGGSVEILSLDGKDSSTFMHSNIFDASGNIREDYSNRIFVLNDEVQLQRITNVSQIDETNFNKYVSKPYKNLFTVSVEKLNIQPFITLTLNNKLNPGEHLRVINADQNKIWEVYGVDASQFTCERYCSVSDDQNGRPIVYRTFFDTNGSISDQVQEIEKAFNLFSEYQGTQFRSGVRGNNWVSIILNDDANANEDWVFQRISCPTLNDFNDSSSGFNNAGLPEDITFFGRFTPNASDFTIVGYDALFGPIDFELFGDRQSIFVNFFKRGNNNLYSFAVDQNVLDKFEKPTLYQGTDKWYRRILDLDVETQEGIHDYQYIKDPLHTADRMIVMTAEEILLLGTKWNAFNIYPLNISLMGINPVKDIDYTVYDSSIGYKSEYFYNRDNDASSFNLYVEPTLPQTLDILGSFIVKSGSGSMVKNGVPSAYAPNQLINTFDGSIYFNPTTSTIITYANLDGSHTYTGYNASVNEENLWDYYESSTFLKYGLTVPSVSKWVGLGNDCRNNPMRLILDASMMLSPNQTNFIPDGSNFSQEISYPSFKYLSPAGRSWEDYIFYDINDVISLNGKNVTFKEAMFADPYTDYFSKLVYSNNNVDATKTRSSIVYYNGYKNTIDTIFMGLNLSIKVQNIAKNLLDIKNYDRYRFCFMSTASRNKDNKRPIEVIINENTKTILMIWYQGNDELNYNMRYSNTLPGKSLMDPTDSGFVAGDPLMSFVKTPYYVNNSIISKSILKFYSKEIDYDNGTARPYAQLNKNLNGFNSIWNAFGNNTISSGVFNVDNYKDYNTFPQYVEYDYVQNGNTFGDYVMNYGYNYNSNTNWYKNNTTNLDTLKYLLAPSSFYVMYYIIRGDRIYNSYDFGSFVNPIVININPPRTFMGMYTYNGWFKPKFNSILEFKSDETAELAMITNRDFTFSNTNLRVYNSIPQLWYNKYVDTVNSQDVAEGNAISYERNFNVFKSLWDADYYYNSQSEQYMDGYKSPDELPSFFGSKIPKFPNQIVLQNWDFTTVTSSISNGEVNLNFNLTRSILSLFKTNNKFLSNWTYFADTDNVIDQYVKNTVLTYYNISQSKIQLDYYYKSNDGTLLHYTLDPDFIKDNKQNFNGQLSYENDEYIYKVVIPYSGNYSYFISFTLTEK